MSTWPVGAFVAPLVPFTVTSSANLAAVTSRLGAALLIALSLVLLTRLVFFPPVRRSQTLTELNTLLNRHENGGTGVVARKWRRRFFAPVRYGDEDELAGSGVEGSEDEVFEWTFTSKPTPDGLRGCLKRVVMETSVEKAVEVVEVEEEGSSSPARRSAKSVRVVEPNLDDIRALRELWASPEMQGPGGLGGIGGYRRTSDFYSKSQGGAAVIKRTTDVGPVQKMAGPGSASTPTEEDESEIVTEDEDDADAARSNPRRPTRVSSLASTTPRSSSLSPSPAARRQRTLSPTTSLTRSGSPAFVVGAAAKSSPSRRRALSPTLGASPRTSSLSPGRPSDRPVVPKWVKTKSGKLASPAPSKLERGEDADEAETTEEEADDDPEAGAAPPPTSLASTLAGIAAVAAAIPPISSDASIAMAPPSSSPASSVLSGGESPQESPTPAPKYTSTRQLKLAVTTSPPLKVRTKPLSPRPKPAPATTSHTKPFASLPSPVSPTPSPSPSVKAERRLSLRVQQSLTLKNHNKPASSLVHATLRGAA